MKKLITLLLVSLILTAPFACKKKNPKPDPEPEPPEGVVVADITKVMDENTRNAIANIDTSDFTFTFTGQTDLIKNMAVGDILVDSASEQAPYGYLRKVTKIEAAKGETKVYTEQAGLTEAVLQGSIRFNSGKLKVSQIKRMVLADGVKLKTAKNTDFTIFDMGYSMDFGSGNEKLTVSGNTRLDLEFFFNFDWDYCILCVPPEVEVTLFESGVEINQSASVNVVSDYGYSTHQRVSLATFYFEPWTFSVGPVPVVFVPKIELFLEADGTVTANFSTGASESFNGKLGTRYTGENGWSVIKEKTFDVDYYPPQLDLSATLKANVGPEVSLLLYGVAGPFANVTACSQLDAQLHTATGNWDLDYKIGVQSETGIRVDVLIFDEEWSSEFCLFDYTLMHLENEPMETGVFFESPADGEWLPLGSPVTLSARVTGPDPTRLDFYADGTLLGSVDQEPWNYIWNTSAVSYGEHTLVVKEIAGSETVASDTIQISLLNAAWEVQDLSYLNQSDETENTDVFFSSADKGWMSGGNAYGFGGYMLQTNDGGNTWEKISPEEGFIEAFKKIIFINENEILTKTYTGKVYSSGSWHPITYISGDEIYETYENFVVSDVDVGSSGLLIATGHFYNEDHYKIFPADATAGNYPPHTPIEIPYYYDDMPTAPKITIRNTKGVIYNLKDQSNPLRQYIMVSEDGGETWEGKQLNASGITRDDDVYGAFFLTEDIGWMVGREIQGFAFVIKTTDGGNTWEKYNVTDVDSFGSVWFLSTEEGYATVNVMDVGDYASTKLYHTQDGGATWTPVDIVHTRLGMYKVFFHGPYLGYTVGQGANVYRFKVGK